MLTTREDIAERDSLVIGEVNIRSSVSSYRALASTDLFQKPESPHKKRRSALQVENFLHQQPFFPGFRLGQ